METCSCRSSRTTGAESVTPSDNLIPLPSVSGDMVLLNTLFPAASDAGDTRQLSNSAPAGSDLRQQKLIKSWKNCITGVHQRFNNVHDFRDALYKYSVAHGFTYCFKKNEGLRVTAKCKAEGCPWRIHASRVPTTQLFQIKTMNGMHTCKAGPDPTTRSKASRKLLASIVKEKLLEAPKCKPKEIAEEIRRDFGIELGYVKAWRALENARGESQVSYKDSYNQLPWLVDKILETNPGSVVTLSTREDLSFHHLFVALHASLYGFQNGCRPLIFLDSFPIKSKYQSSLLTATALDGNDEIFPVAFGVVDALNDDNWHWFLLQLKSALSTCQSITFVTDRLGQLRASILSVFENSYYCYCVHHLTEELKRDLKGSYTEEVVSVIVAHLYDAAQVGTLDEFSKFIDSIKSVSSEAFDWILRSEPENWANALFKGSRHNQMTSHIAESFYCWVGELPELPIVQIISTICRKIMELMYSRRMDSNQWLTKLTPSLEDKLQNEMLKTHSLQVLLGLGSSFEVRGLGTFNVVNIDVWDCNCRGWQLNGFPCVHAVAVLQHVGRNLPDYCSKFYTTEAFRLTYSESVNPVPAVDQLLQASQSAQVQVPVQVRPPPLLPLTGPPKKRRIRWRGRPKRELHCSKCKGAGHNRKTCHVYA